MSLIRQVWLLLAVTLVLAFAAAFGITVHSARQYLETQLGLIQSVGLGNYLQSAM